MRTVLAALALVLWTSTTAAAAPGVLVLFSDERAFSATFEAEGALRTALGLPGADIDYSSEFLDLARFPEPAADGTWRDFLRAKYRGHDIRVVIVAGTGAFDFMSLHRAELFPGVPMLVFAVPAYMLETRTVPANTMVLPFDYDLAGTIAGARRLQPNAKEIVVAIGANADIGWNQRVLATVKTAAGSIPIRVLNELTMEAMKQRVGELTADSIHLLVPIYRDSTGRIRRAREEMLELARAATAPSYSVFALGPSTTLVGGAVISFDNMGRWAGELALRVINGDTTAALASHPPMRPTFEADWRQLSRWGIDESLLPPGAVVRYRLPNVWQEYRVAIITTISLLTLLALAITALLVQRHRRDEAELQVLHHRNELAHLTRVSLIGELSASIAHELHQPLTAILSNAQAAQRFLQAPEPDLKLIKEILADIATDDRRAGDVIQRLRDLLKKGEPKFEALECDALVDSVVKLARGDLHTRVVSVAIEIAGNLPRVHGDQVQLQQVLLNLLMNAADAMRELSPSERSVRISVVPGEPGTVVFAVADRGHGIPDAAQSQLFEPFFTTKAKGLGMGLAISRSIAEAHRGQLWATNNPDRGATFFLKLRVARQ